MITNKAVAIIYNSQIQMMNNIFREVKESVQRIRPWIQGWFGYGSGAGGRRSLGIILQPLNPNGVWKRAPWNATVSSWRLSAIGMPFRTLWMQLRLALVFPILLKANTVDEDLNFGATEPTTVELTIHLPECSGNLQEYSSQLMLYSLKLQRLCAKLAAYNCEVIESMQRQHQIHLKLSGPEGILEVLNGEDIAFPHAKLAHRTYSNGSIPSVSTDDNSSEQSMRLRKSDSSQSLNSFTEIQSVYSVFPTLSSSELSVFSQYSIPM